MRSSPRIKHLLLLRPYLLWLTLLSHALVAFAVPVPVATRRDDRSSPYPCQYRMCGCVSAKECWKGDCCCFTLEEKLAWAETQGVEPPDHVRPLIASRKAVAPRSRPEKSCCAESEGNCCELSPSPEAASCEACSEQMSCSKKTQKSESDTFRWVVSLHAQKCRGTDSKGCFQLDPAIVPSVELITFPMPDLRRPTYPSSQDGIQIAICPPTPPPKIS